MNNQDFMSIVKTMTDEALAILDSKGKEYAGNDDRLANFKDIARELGITPQQVCLVYLKKHIRALEHSARTNTISMEEGTRAMDCINYLFFFVALREERYDGAKLPFESDVEQEAILQKNMRRNAIPQNQKIRG